LWLREERSERLGAKGPAGYAPLERYKKESSTGNLTLWLREERSERLAGKARAGTLPEAGKQYAPLERYT